MEMIEWLSAFLENDNTRLIYVLILIAIANVFDFVMGWLNAKFNPDIDFVSFKALFGIIKKIVYFMILVYFIPVALILPNEIGMTALWVLYLGYLASELNSVFAHLNLTDDKKQNQLFIDFINKFIGGNKHE